MAVFQTSRRGYNFIVFAGALIAVLTLTDKVLCKRSFTCDSNRDGDVTEFDALGFSEDFGLTTCAKGPPCAGDLDRDDDIDTADLGLFDNLFARLKDADFYTRAKPISSTLTAKPCEGDFDADGDLDGSDLVVFSADFGRTDCTSPPPCEGDFDADGDVDGSDLIGLSADFGRTDCPLTPPQDIDYGFLADELEGGGGLVGGTIRMVNGNAIEYREDLTFPSPHRLRLAFRATYNSQSDRVGALGHGWTHTYEISLNPSFQLGNQTFLKIVDEMGRASYFQEDLTGEYLGAFGEHSQVKAENGGYVWYRLDGTKYRISPAGRLNLIDDQIGNRLQLNYNTQTQLLETVTDQTTGRTLRFYYDNGFLDYIKGPETEKVADGIWVAFDYDTNQNLTSVTYADGSSSPTDCTDCSGFTYDYAAPSNHNLTQKQDKHADRHLLNSWGYDENDRAVDNFKNSTIFFSIKGVSIEYVSDTQVKVTDAYGTLRTYTLEEVNGRKRVTAMTGPASAPYTDSNAKRWVFDGQMNLTEVEYAGGTINQYQDHDARGRAQTIKLAVGTPEARIITYTYHPQMGVILTRAEKSLLQEGAKKLTTWDFDDDYDSQPNESPTGLLSRIIEQGYTQDGSGDVVPYEYVTELNYNSKGQVTSVNAPRQPFGVNDDITLYDYDDQATHKWNLVGISRPYIGTTQFPISEYDDAGMPGKMIDVNNQSTIFSYDGRGRITSITHNADSSIGSLFYNAGKLDTTTDEDGVTRSFAYDSTYDRLERIYDHDGNYIQYDYDGKGNRVTIGKYDNQDSRTYRKHFNYEDQPDIPGKLWRVINPDGSCEKDICADSSYTEYQYDNAGNVFSIRDPEGHTTEYEYDAFNRIKKVKQTLPPPQVGTEPIDVITRYAYDKHGNLWKITDAEGNTTFYTHDDMGRVVETISPDAGTTSYLYDEAGNLKLKRDEKGITVKYYYDFLNRLLQVDFPAYDQHSAYSITYTYDEGKDGMGHRTGMKDASGSTVFEYDNRGRLVGKIVTVNEVPYPLTRTYTPGSRISSMALPSGRNITYATHSNGKVQEVTTNYNSDTDTLVSNLTYNPFGKPKTMNTALTGPVNNQSGECDCLEVANPGQPMEQVYTYDGNRNLTSILGTNTPRYNRNFTYDPLNRLKNAIGPHGTISYTYDKVGNRMTRTEAGQTDAYAYVNGTNKIDEITGANPAAFTYDENGNLTGIGTKTIVYNQDNRLTEVVESGKTIGDYTYNGLGQRVIKSVGGETTIFHYDFEGQIIGESQLDGTFTAEYLYLGSSRLAMVDVTDNNATYHYLNNYLGTPQIMTNPGGTVVWEAQYKPFGEAAVHPSSMVKNNFRFPGQYFDHETGLHYNYHRYYDPRTGRYLTPDPIGLAGGINLFAYALNNPINQDDPSGVWTFSIGSTIGATLFGFGGGGGTFLNIGYSENQGLSVSITGTAQGGAVAGKGGSVGITVNITDAESVSQLVGTGGFNIGRSGLGQTGIGYLRSTDGSHHGLSVSYNVRSWGYVGANFTAGSTVSLVEWTQNTGFSFLQTSSIGECE